jgi:hypothetical protein
MEDSSEGLSYMCLKAFDDMNDHERGQRFGRLLGGTRILNCVGRVLKQEWSSSDGSFRVASNRC